MFPKISFKVKTYFNNVTFLQILSLPFLLILFLHAYRSYEFVNYHYDLTKLISFKKGFVIPYSFCTFDLIIAISVVGTFLAKTYLFRKACLSEHESSFYFWMIIICGLVATLYIPIAFASFSYQYNYETFASPILKVLEDYPENDLKEELDRVQIKYSCCGLKEYRDWFKIRWYETNEKMEVSNVPFSCCSYDIGMPCVHYNIEAEEQNILYNYESNSTKTIWTEGCLMKVNDYFNEYETLASNALAISIAALLFSFYDRILQSAESYIFIKGKIRGWIFGKRKTPKAHVVPDSDSESEESSTDSDKSITYKGCQIVSPLKRPSQTMLLNCPKKKKKLTN